MTEQDADKPEPPRVHEEALAPAMEKPPKPLVVQLITPEGVPAPLAAVTIAVQVILEP